MIVRIFVEKKIVNRFQKVYLLLMNDMEEIYKIIAVTRDIIENVVKNNRIDQNCQTNVQQIVTTLHF